MQALNAACSYMSAKVEKVNTRINQSQDIIYDLGNVKDESAIVKRLVAKEEKLQRSALKRSQARLNDCIEAYTELDDIRNDCLNK
jgi:hypothetical protein